jgi:hypothetical protein
MPHRHIFGSYGFSVSLEEAGWVGLGVYLKFQESIFDHGLAAYK